MKEYISREERAQKLLENTNTHILRINDRHFQLKSLATNRIYDIMTKLHKWSCTCADHKYRFVECKHIKAIRISIELKQEARKRNKVTISPPSTNECRYCYSANIKKYGILKNKYGNVQRYICRGCSKTFTFNAGFEGMCSSPQTITSALQLYFTGESLRSIQKFLKIIHGRKYHTRQSTFGSKNTQNSWKIILKISFLKLVTHGELTRFTSRSRAIKNTSLP